MVGKTNAKGAGGVAPVATFMYGYDIVVATSSPSGRVTYPSEVDNAGFTPALMTFGGSFSYGDWPSAVGQGFMPRPCMLLYDGTVDYYLDPNDYTKKSDGVTASDVANTAYGGNAMMEWGKLYTHRSFYNGVYSFRVSDMKIAEDWDCWSNYDLNDNEIPHFYTPIYFGSSASGKLRSISGQSNYVSGTREQEITLATANGDGWYTEVLADRLLIQDLLVMMAKSTNTQISYGWGRVLPANGTATINTGTMNTSGIFWGSDNKTGGVKVFGMENLWGNLWRAQAGWVSVNGTQKIKITRGIHDGSVATDYNLDGTNYITLLSSIPSGTSGSYISDMKNDLLWGRFPIVASGSAITFESDSLWYPSTQQTSYAVCGGGPADDAQNGAFYTSLSSIATYTSILNGAALSCKPIAA